MTALYDEVLLDHFRNPRNVGSLADPDIVYEDVNPLCGDRIRIELKLCGNRIEAARFRGDGCAISIASASMLTELIAGASIDEGDVISSDVLLSALKSTIRSSRMKCAMLALDVLRAGVKHYRGPENADP